MWKQTKSRLGKTGLSLLCCMQVAVLGMPLQQAAAAETEAVQMNRQMEYLDRGVVAVRTNEGIFVSWRLLGTDPSEIAFNLYRDGKKINSSPITGSTNFIDKKGSASGTYSVRSVIGGREQRDAASAGVWANPYLDVPLQKPADGVNPDGTPYTYSANDASVGDVDGDGQYELILKWDPSNSQDNSRNGFTGPVYVDTYKLDGTLLWRIDLGRNIRAGAHYTQFMVYDLDGDGKAEVAMKTADGTVDGTGRVIGDANADYRNDQGRVLDGPEFLTIFNGLTGAEMATVPYDPPRGNVSDWGDGYGNRVDRFLAAVAYLDGERPSLIMARGYYTRAVLAAYNWRDGQLTKVWTFDSNDPGNGGYAGQGNHNLSVADVDGDGKDEIIYGACAIDHDGTGLYTTGLGHGDAMHLGDLDPARPGMEVFQVHESKTSPYGLEFRDADSGETIWGVYTGKDTGRGMSADIDPNYVGEEVWASGGFGLFNAKGEKIGDEIPSSINHGIWWDGDLLRELLDHNWNAPDGIGKIDKWNYETKQTVNLLTAENTRSNNYTKGNPSLQADLLGDWREEAIWRTADSSALRIFTTTHLTDYRLPTLMHDPVYRLGIAWQNVSYNQPPHTSYYLGEGMTAPAKPNIYVTVPAKIAVHPNHVKLKDRGGKQPLTVRVSLDRNIGASIDEASVTMSVYGSVIAAEAPKGRHDEDHGNDRDSRGERGSKHNAVVTFDRSKVNEALTGASGTLEVTVSGRLTDGSRFSGTDTIEVRVD
ncbi:rhamnogalacturonan lyase [Paenibacillus turpanensis]|uniref:rhamnogalacturonan lyase n=1 Tax=Paenibacillus turpanensis TaxID=2689078 RepID=UPI003C7AC277